VHQTPVFSLLTRIAILSALAWCVLAPGPARALDKVDPYICPTKQKSTGMDCFLEAVPQTYTMCRQIKSIEVLEFGLIGAQEGVNGAKTESCIEKHRLSIARPYGAALLEARNPNEVQALRKLHNTWLESLARIRPASPETDEGYKLRIAEPYADFDEQIRSVRALIEAPVPPSAKQPAKKLPPKSQSK
jgi:hypothetical protein